MKVGLILECGPVGADKQVCKHIVSKFFPDVELVDPVTLDNKPNLIAKCGSAAALLLTEGCERVVVVWDLHPAWREDRARPCRKSDCDAARQSLTNAGVKTDEAFLVCVEEELEAWLLADGRALCAFLSRPTRRVEISDSKKPDLVRKPKTTLCKIMQQNGGGLYNDRVHALRIAQNIPDLNKIKKSPTFCRFILKVTGTAL